MTFIFRNILWVDCIGAIATGILLIALSSLIGPLFGLPRWLVVAHGLVHLSYGSFSLSLAVRKTRPLYLIKLLVFANASWAVLCIIFATIAFSAATGFAVAQFALEGMYVGLLALIEWKRRGILSASEA
jgi:hypothetical protein